VRRWLKTSFGRSLAIAAPSLALLAVDAVPAHAASDSVSRAPLVSELFEEVASPAPTPSAMALAFEPALDFQTVPIATAPPKDDRLGRLGIAGGLMLGNVYMFTITIATAALVVCWADPHDSTCLLPDTRAVWYDLYIPVAGPFVAFRHEAVRDNLGYALSFGVLGSAQGVGLVLASAALLIWKDDDALASLSLTPQVSSNHQGLSLTGRF
jgi:hypothetical protein